MTISNRLRALEMEVRALGEPDWPAVARALAAAEGPRGTFRLPADASAEVIAQAKLICGMESAMPRDRRQDRPAVFVAGKRVWPPQGAELPADDEDCPGEPEGPSGPCDASGGPSAET